MKFSILESSKYIQTLTIKYCNASVLEQCNTQPLLSVLISDFDMLVDVLNDTFVLKVQQTK